MTVWRRIRLAAVRMLVLIAAGTAPVARAAGVENSTTGPLGYLESHVSPFALNATKAFHVTAADSPAVARRLAWMKELGVRCDRTELWWHIVEPQPGVFNWARPDRVFAEFEQAGVEWYPVLCYGAAWWKRRTAPTSDDEIEQFANYVYETLSRYRGRARYWSLWNEPNTSIFWNPKPDPDRYASLLKAARAAARRADPDARICAPAAAPRAGLDRAYIERLFQLGALDDIDIFDYHYYRNHAPEIEVPAELALIRALMARYGTEKPIWISETGVSSGIPPGPGVTDPATETTDSEADLSYDRQAAYVVRNHLLCLALGVQRIFYFDLQNWFDDQAEVWDSTLGLVEASGRRKPSFHAYQTMVQQTAGLQFVGRCRSQGEGVEGVLMRDRSSGELTLAAWNAREEIPREIQVPCGDQGLEVTDRFGTITAPAAGSSAGSSGVTSVATVTIDHHPRYIRGISGADYLIDAAVQLLPAHTILSPDEQRPLSVAITDSGFADTRLTVAATTVPKGILWDVESGTVRLEADVRPGRYTLQAEVDVMHGNAGDSQVLKLARSAIVEVVPALTLTVRPHQEFTIADYSDWSSSAEERLHIAVTLKNASRELSGTLRLQLSSSGSDPGILFETEPSEQHLKPFEIRHVQLSLPLSLIRSATGILTLRAQLGAWQSRPFSIVPVPFSLEKERPLVDGSFGEWSEETASINLDRAAFLTRSSAMEYEPQDASARVRFLFTPDTLYLAAEVADDQPPHNPSAPAGMWNGDALDLYLGLGGPTRRTAINRDFEYRLGLAPTTRGGNPSLFDLQAGLPLEQAPMVVRALENGYMVEAAIPLAHLNTPVPPLEVGRLVAVDVTLHDLDTDDCTPAGDLPGRSMTWNGTPMNWIDPSGWGMAILVPPPARRDP